MVCKRLAHRNSKEANQQKYASGFGVSISNFAKELSGLENDSRGKSRCAIASIQSLFGLV